MSGREKKLAVCFSAILIVLVFGWGLRAVAGKGGRSLELTFQLSEFQELANSCEVWENREQWLSENTLAYPSDVLAASALAERIGILVKAHRLKVSSQELPAKVAGEDLWYNQTKMKIEVSGDIKNIVECIHEIQDPIFFTGVEQLQLQSSDSGDMACTLELTHWYVLN
ncbi:MAG: GspMb/PilO family protein [Verrucomicrobiales bacterium]|nr:GspMb/PilO family protein [Verrucomicrobiales bacterium]